MQSPMPASTPSESEDSIIPGPLDSIEKILVDSKIEDRIADVDSPENIALQIWEDYGGKVTGGVHNYAIGTRRPKDSDRPMEEVKKENEANEDKKWERLPIGEKISDVTSIEELSDSIKKSMLSLVKKVKGKSAPPSGPSGGMPML